MSHYPGQHWLEKAKNRFSFKVPKMKILLLKLDLTTNDSFSTTGLQNSNKVLFFEITKSRQLLNTKRELTLLIIIIKFILYIDMDGFFKKYFSYNQNHLDAKSPILHFW